MSGKKKILMAVLLVLMLAATAVGLVWHMNHYVMIDFQFYPKDAEVLDLRDEDIGIERYEKIARRLPECEILWNIPFQGRVYAQDTKSLTVTSLTDADVEVLAYFTRLETVEAGSCTDYAQLLALQDSRPEMEINYSVEIGGSTYFRDASKVVISKVVAEEIQRLRCLPKLETVAVSGGENVENVAALQEFCRKNGYAFHIAFDSTTVAEDAKAVSVSNITEAELNLLQFLPNMTQLRLNTPEAPAESLLALQEAYPNVTVTWSQTVSGKLFESTDTEIDISNIEVENPQIVEQEMTYFPNAEKLVMSFCGIDDELMAAFRELHREDYKVVWTVYLGPKLPTRTDVTSIMPARDGTSVFHDAEAYNMRYCEDVIAVDVGHLDVRNVEWAAFMPHLKYLILAWTGVQDLTPLSNCKELVFLELDNSPVKDLSPLKGCTALEDINIGASYADASALCEMPWLKNVWCIFRPDAAWQVSQALPDTFVQATGDATVASGWRRLDNYYKMRDALNMFYMEW